MGRMLSLCPEALGIKSEKELPPIYEGKGGWLTDKGVDKLELDEIKRLMKQYNADFILTNVKKVPAPWWECGCDIIQYRAGSWWLAQKDSPALPLRVKRTKKVIWQGVTPLNFSDVRMVEFFIRFGYQWGFNSSHNTGEFIKFDESTKEILQQLEVGVIATDTLSESWKAFFEDPELKDVRMIYWNGEAWYEVLLGNDRRFVCIRL